MDSILKHSESDSLKSILKVTLAMSRFRVPAHIVALNVPRTPEKEVNNKPCILSGDREFFLEIREFFRIKAHPPAQAQQYPKRGSSGDPRVIQKCPKNGPPNLEPAKKQKI